MTSHPETRAARDLFSRDQLARPEDFRRALTIEKSAVDVQARTAVLSFSSEFPVLRIDARGQEFYEVLDHATADLSRLRDGAPLLYGHERSQHIGTILKAEIGPDKKGRAMVKFSRSQIGQDKLNDVADQILVKSSAGYDLSDAEYVADGELAGRPVYRFLRWLATEVSLVPLPADPTVGVGRGESPTRAPAKSAQRNQPIISMSDSTVTNHARDIVEAASILKPRHDRHREAIDAACTKFVSEGRSLDEFNRHVLRNILATSEDVTPDNSFRQDPMAAQLGLSAKDISRYSILRAIKAKADNRPLDGLEGECNAELTRKLGRSPLGFYLPDEVTYSRRSMRGLSAGVPANGGYLVGEQILGNELVELARNESRVVELGARMISGLVGDISVPRQLTGATAYWVSEGGSLTQSNATFGQIVGKPRRVGTSVPYSKQFLAQAGSLDAEAFVVADSDRSIATELDRVAIRGAGGVEPLGIINLATGDRSTSVTFGGAATFAKLTEFEANVGGNNTLSGRPAYLTTWATKAKLKTLQKFTGAGVGLWNTDEDVAGYRGRTTAQFPSSPVANQVIFGDFSQILYLEWAGRDVVVDPFTGKKEGTVEVCISRLVDLIIRQGKAFAISTDSGAQ